jgi:hypothetical protein
MYTLTMHELEFVIEVFEDLRVLADPSEYLEGEVEEAVNILRSLKIKEIDMTEENTQEAFDVEAYAATLFDMLSPENDYAVGPEILVYINENPVAEEDQEKVTTALKALIDAALAPAEEAEEVAEEGTQDETAEETNTADADESAA